MTIIINSYYLNPYYILDYFLKYILMMTSHIMNESWISNNVPDSVVPWLCSIGWYISSHRSFVWFPSICSGWPRGYSSRIFSFFLDAFFRIFALLSIERSVRDSRQVHDKLTMIVLTLLTMLRSLYSESLERFRRRAWFEFVELCRRDLWYE